MKEFEDFIREAFDLAAIPGKPEALSGIRVLELATRIYGPATADYLGEFGAEVIKVELPGKGDLMRYVAPEAFFWKDVSPAFLPQNRNKRHVAIDVRVPEGKELFIRLAELSDVVVENLRAGTMDKWGIGYRRLRERNPRLVYAANSGFGQWGPFAAGRASYDATAQAVSGMSAITGFPGHPPVRVGLWIGDFTGSLFSAIAILAALHARRRTEEGQLIDLAQAEVLIRTLDWTWLYADRTGKDRPRAGNLDPAFPPSGIYRCADGFAAVSVLDDDERAGLARAVGGAGTSAGTQAVPAEDVAAFTAGRTREEVRRISEEFGFSAAPVEGGRDQYRNPHLRARGTVWELDDPLYGRIDEFGPVPKLSASPGRIKWTAKPVGYHNGEVFGGLLGLTAAEMADLEREKAIGKWADVPGARPPSSGPSAGPTGGDRTSEGERPSSGPRARPIGGGRTSEGKSPPSSPIRAPGRGVPEEGKGTNDYESWAAALTDPASAPGKPEALEGLLVVEHAPAHFGAMVAASVLGELGATVIKIEPPAGDPSRRLAPGGIAVGGTGLAFLSEARNRKFVTLDLGREEGRRLFRRLVDRADVVVAASPARMEAAGIGYRALSRGNPGLIWLALSTYGSFGPHAGRPVRDADILIQALSGVPYVTGDPEEEGSDPAVQVPTKVGSWHGWFAQGLWGAFGTLCALRFREATGKGQFVDVSGAEGLMKFVDYNITWMHTAGKERRRTGKFDPAVFPYTYIRCRDGHAFIAAYNDDAFESLMKIIGRPELAADPRFATGPARTRLENEKALHAILEAWSATRTADEILGEIEAHTSKKGGPGAAVVTGRVNRPLETLAEANWRARGCFVRFADPVHGDLLLAAPPWKMSGTPPRLRSACRPPGADNRDVYEGLLGLTEAESAALASAGIV